MVVETNNLEVDLFSGLLKKDIKSKTDWKILIDETEDQKFYYLQWYFTSSFDKGTSADSKTESHFTAFPIPKYFKNKNKIKIYN